jgi:hypothetical protein
VPAVGTGGYASSLYPFTIFFFIIFYRCWGWEFKGFKGSRVQRFKGSRVQGFQGFRVERLRRKSCLVNFSDSINHGGTEGTK